ncbi:fluoride efflux transporter CrcB [Bacillus dakarensis]|uniref:fluoride efflux transporter CrcB n=1 Tax=Robertmurraya dakarensis TaxID=1926278 RepID=UPI0009822362|nr:fluoride efflux transporter CrcB [Bacillus dakarensis]
MIYLFIGVAGSFGAILRYMTGVVLYDESVVFPFATLTVNLIGSFLLAWFTTGIVKWFSLSPLFKAAIGTGFIGSFTTFSALSVETVTLVRNGDLVLALIYVLVSVFGGLVMSRVGFSLSKGEAV